MRRLGLVILLLGVQLSLHAQTEEQYSAVVFYTTEITGTRPIPVLYSNGQKIGDVTKDQSIRLIVRPGTYTFKLTEEAQLPASIGTGQELFLRITRTAFFLGNATEASASPWIVAPISLGAQLSGTQSASSRTNAAPDLTNVPTRRAAIFTSEPSQQQERSPRRTSEQGTSGILRCAFSGTLSIHSALQPASPVIARIRCGDPVILIDNSYMYPHVRTQDGKAGYILSLNFGQWAIGAQTQSTQATTAGSAVPTPASPNEDYVIGPEDLLEINVWREPELTTKTVVRPDGKIGIPLLSEVQASGLTTRQLREHLQQQFAEYVQGPQVSITVMDSRSQVVHIIGGVVRPGSYRLAGPLTVMELLARAGGLLDSANKEEIAIVRSEGGKTHREIFNYKRFVEGRNLQQNVSLRNGDVVVVP